MYSTGTINHNGKSYLPGGRITPGTSELLDCGHPRPAVDPQAFSLPWGYIETKEGKQEYCLACCLALEVEAIKVMPAGAGYTAYYDVKQDIITDWHGNKLMRIRRCRVYRHNFGGRFIAITAVDSAGCEWHGRASYDTGEIINLYKSKVNP